MTINDFAYFAFMMDGYKASDQARKAADTDIFYYGFLDSKGNWYIMEHDTTAGVNNLQTFRFKKGTSGYTTNWTNRETLTYDYFNTIFG